MNREAKGGPPPISRICLGSAGSSHPRRHCRRQAERPPLDRVKNARRGLSTRRDLGHRARGARPARARSVEVAGREPPRVRTHARPRQSPRPGTPSSACTKSARPDTPRTTKHETMVSVCEICGTLPSRSRYVGDRSIRTES